MTEDQKLVHQLWIGNVDDMGSFRDGALLSRQVEATNRLVGTDYVVTSDDGENYYVARRPTLVFRSGVSHTVSGHHTREEK